MPPARKLSQAEVGLRQGFRSGLERQVAVQLEGLGIGYLYEGFPIPFLQPAKPRRYTPDTVLPNGIIIETKGQFPTADRQKHLMVAAGHPELDIRFVFSRSGTRISKQSKTTYAAWCQFNGFMYADKYIPEAWLREPPDRARQDAILRIVAESKKPEQVEAVLRLFNRKSMP